MQTEKKSKSPSTTATKILDGMAFAGATVAATAAAFIVMRYRTCSPSYYLVRTGPFISHESGIAVSKRGVVWPFQMETMVSMEPQSYRISLSNMSKELMEFELPLKLTIGPYDPLEDHDKFLAYAKTVSEVDRAGLSTLIQGVVEGEARSLTSTLTIMDMFNGKAPFKDEVGGKIQKHLDPFGLRIHNINIQEMHDSPGNSYFSVLKQSAIENAIKEADIKVAEANKIGTIGKQERVRDTRIAKAQLDADALIAENSRKEDEAHSLASLARVEAGADMTAQMAKIEAENKVKQRDEELRQQVEIMKAQAEAESLRASEWTRTKIQAEQNITAAEGEARSIEIVAKANRNAKLLEAEGIQALLEAQAVGIENLMGAGNPELVKFYLGLEKGLYPELARHQADALQGLNPKINVWNMGSDEKNSNPLSPLLRGLQSLAPLADGLASQTDAQVPFWGPKTPSPATQEGSTSAAVDNGSDGVASKSGALVNPKDFEKLI